MKKNKYFEIVLLSAKKEKILLEKSKINQNIYRLPFVLRNKKSELSENKQIVDLVFEKYQIKIELRDLVFLGKIQREHEENSIFLTFLEDSFFNQEFPEFNLLSLNEIIENPSILEDYLKWLIIMIKHEKVNNIEFFLNHIQDY